jgi:hypothetical protein
MQDFTQCLGTLAETYLRRRLTRRDGIPKSTLARAEARLGRKIPDPLRTYYALAGRADELNAVHNVLYPPNQLVMDGTYLVFMDENQSVVSWGLRLTGDAVDPVVWQRNNTPPPQWFSERRHLAAFLAVMFRFYRRNGLFR